MNIKRLFKTDNHHEDVIIAEFKEKCGPYNESTYASLDFTERVWYPNNGRAEILPRPSAMWHTSEVGFGDRVRELSKLELLICYGMTVESLYALLLKKLG